jgi:hypothetical protein
VADTPPQRSRKESPRDINTAPPQARHHAARAGDRCSHPRRRPPATHTAPGRRIGATRRTAPHRGASPAASPDSSPVRQRHSPRGRATLVQTTPSLLSPRKKTPLRWHTEKVKGAPSSNHINPHIATNLAQRRRRY